MSIQCLKNGKFQAQVRAPGEKAACKTFSTFEEAEEFERNTMRAIKAARSLPETRRVYARQMKPVGVAALAAMSFKSLVDEFAAERPEHCYARYAEKLKQLVGDARVFDFDKKWTKKFCERMRTVEATNRGNFLAEATIGQYIGMIRLICNWKAESLEIEKPRLGLTTEFLKPGWDDGRERRLRGDEESRIRAELGIVGAKTLTSKKHPPGARGRPWACARHYQLLFDFAIETCARQAEMVELPWKEIDMERGVWMLPATRSKTERRRKIYLTPRALEVLRELWLDKSPTSGLAFHRLPSAAGFCNTFHKVVERLDIEDLVFHDLRHEGISRHRVAKHFEPEVLMKMVGHSSPKMTMRYFNPEDEEVFAHMEAAMLKKLVADQPSAMALAAAESKLALRFEEFVSSLGTDATTLEADPVATRAGLDRKFQEFMATLQAGRLATEN